MIVGEAIQREAAALTQVLKLQHQLTDMRNQLDAANKALAESRQQLDQAQKELAVFKERQATPAK